jgi:hypothetical protein
MSSRSSERPIAELVRELVKQEMAKQKISGHGGNTDITSDRDINLTTLGTGKEIHITVGKAGKIVFRRSA